MKKAKKEARKQEKAMIERLRDYRVSKRIKVNDDWSPNFPHNEVCISHRIVWFNGKGEVIQSVFGMDDAVVERRFHSTDPDELIKQWELWKVFYDKVPQVTNKRWYLERGFVDG